MELDRQNLEHNYPFKTEIERKAELSLSIQKALNLSNYTIGSEILLDLVYQYSDETLETLSRISGHKKNDRENSGIIKIRDFLESFFKVNSYRKGVPQHYINDDKLINGTTLHSLRIGLLAKLNEEEVNSPLLQELSICRTTEIKLWLATKLTKEHSKVFSILKTDDDKNVVEATIFRQLPSRWRNLTTDEKVKKIFREDVPLSILEIIVQSPRMFYQECIALSQSISKSSLKILNIKHQKKSSRYESLIESARREHVLPIEWRVLTDNERISKLKYEMVNEKILETLSYSESPEVNIAVVLNSNVPLNILKRMRRDKADKDIQLAINQVIHSFSKYTVRKLTAKEKSELKKVDKQN